MNRPASLGSFFAAATAWFLAIALIWLPVSPWLSHPAAGMAHIVLGNAAKDWVRKVEKSPGRLEVETRISAASSVNPGQRASAVAIVEAKPASYAYGLPLYLALLLASRGRHLLGKAIGGYFILLLPQSFSLVFGVLKNIIAVAAGPAALGIGNGQTQAIVLAGMFGTLLLPVLAPVVLWLWLDRSFLSSVIVEGWLRRATED
jgi:hypothetical protein